jgi:hypothetical protein
MRIIMRTLLLAAVAALMLGGGCRHKTSGDAIADAGPDDERLDAGRSDAAEARAPEPPLGAVTSGTTATLRSVWASADLSLAVAVGDDGTIVTSHDAGKTWTVASSGVMTKLGAVWGSAADDVWAVGDADPTGSDAGMPEATVLHSTDRGASWSRVSLGASAPNLTAIWGSGADQIFVGGANSVVYRTRDRGVTFETVSNGGLFATGIAGISGTSATDIWAARGYRILHSTNGGDSWQEINAENIYIQYAIWAGGLEDVYTVNANAVVRRYDSTAGPEGTLFLSKLDSALCQGCLELHAVSGSGPDDVWVVGDDGFAAHSTVRDEWREAAAGAADLHGVTDVGGVVIAVGEAGTIVRR